MIVFLFPSVLFETLSYPLRQKYTNNNLFFLQVVGDSIAFSLGLATTLALLGVGASFAGKAYGQIGQGLPLAASGLAIIMGLNLLEVLFYCTFISLY